MNQPRMIKLTPIIVVETIEPVLPFWTERLGFQVTAEVPHGDRVGFVILAKDGVELMYQTRASVQDDVPALTGTVAGQTSTLFLEVESVDEVEKALEGVEVLVPRRRTFYGMDELFVLAYCGTVVGFASRVEA